MFERVAIDLHLLLPLTLVLGCASGGEDDQFGTFGSFQTTVSMDENDEAEEDESEETADSSMDSTTTTGDGDTDTTTGDGDTDTTTTGDGDTDTTTTTTTGDEDTDGGAMCGNGIVEPGETCDGGNFNGASCALLGYDGGMLSCNNCAVSTAGCTNSAQPGLGQLYSHCLDNTNCPNLDGCITVMEEGQMNPFDGFCTNICVSDAECGNGAAIGGTAIPRCNNEPTRYCELDCSDGKTCPQGMECILLVGDKELCF